MTGSHRMLGVRGGAVKKRGRKAPDSRAAQLRLPPTGKQEFCLTLRYRALAAYRKTLDLFNALRVANERSELSHRSGKRCAVALPDRWITKSFSYRALRWIVAMPNRQLFHFFRKILKFHLYFPDGDVIFCTAKRKPLRTKESDSEKVIGCAGVADGYSIFFDRVQT